MAGTTRRYERAEIAQRAEEVFERRVQPRVQGHDALHFLAMDVQTGEFEIDADELTAMDRLQARVPDAQIWLRRVGSRTAHRIGFAPAQAATL